MQGTLDLSKPFHSPPAGGGGHSTADLRSLMLLLDEWYSAPDPRPHELHSKATGVTRPEGSPMASGNQLPLDRPCDQKDLWSLFDRTVLRAAAVACHTDQDSARLPLNLVRFSSKVAHFSV